jgi:hypothetical protein
MMPQRQSAPGVAETKKQYEIQILASDDARSVQTLADRCTIEADSLPEAAAKYAALFMPIAQRYTP